MNKEELKIRLSEILPELTFPEIHSTFLNVECALSKLLQFSNEIRDKEELKFDFLFCLTAVDRTENLEVIYHLRSTLHNHEFILRVKTAGREIPVVASVTSVWPTAEFHEREVFDLFGISFTGHPDLRRIFLEDDWVGYPLRKDYIDDVNMVAL